MSQDEVITSRDGELADMVMGSVDDNMEQYGIEVMLLIPSSWICRMTIRKLFMRE